MQNKPQSEISAPTYIINRSNTDSSYTVWKLDPGNPELVTRVTSQQQTSLSASQYHLCTVGGYLMAYSKLDSGNEYDIDYRVFEFDVDEKNPLSGQVHQQGSWKRSKFISYSSHFTWPDNKNEDILQLIPVTGYVLAYIPTSARATYCLWNFDPALDSPKPQKSSKPKKKSDDPTIGPDPLSNSISTMDAFALIGENSRLLPVDNYVLEWIPTESSSTYRVWSFDPQEMTPLALPAISEGTWADIDDKHQLLVLGNYILDWIPGDLSYRLWLFDPHQEMNPLVGPIQVGTLPSSFDANGVLTAAQPHIPLCKANAKTPGTMDFMREKIKHVVVYMVESRSMDSVLGWLYENSTEKINFINGEDVFEGTSISYFNEANGKPFYVYKFNDGKLSDKQDLNAPTMDPYHGTPDSIHQQYSGGYADYFAGKQPDMGGFVKNNCSGEVMATFTHEQLPVLNGLAKSFAVSDQWFSPMPGGTDSNRAIALTGSAFNITTTLEGNPQYENFPDRPHRQSLWKVLWNNGIKDWKIYWSVDWLNEVFTYQLYLKGDIPSVDNNVADGKTDYITPFEQFKIDVDNKQLPAFSFIEPVWIAPSGATSYHPAGDLVPAEKQLNDIYETVAKGPGWEQTALIITFSKGGCLYDHVSPPKTINPWPKDSNDGFTYDVLGPRVPTIVVSPWVNEHTVFRAPGETPLSATSIAATLLDWFGIPKARWGLGDRIPQSETFEFVFERTTPRKDVPHYKLPYDKTFPPLKDSTWKKTAPSGEWNTKANWNDESIATDKAIFSRSNQTDITFAPNCSSTINAIEFDADAPTYNFLFG
ncbi:MAG: alkaline phosphatase family protein, partial [Gammaproteobacteria bacterium]|nr:alkaline phosphatase family protein [Gammaproteobacteria bacterium]